MNFTYWLILGVLIIVIYFAILLKIQQYKTKTIKVDKLLIKDDFIKVIYSFKKSKSTIKTKNPTYFATIDLDNLLTIKRKTIGSSFIYIIGFITLLSIGPTFRAYTQLINNSYDYLGGILLVFLIFILSVLLLTLTVIKYSKYSIINLKFKKNNERFRYLNLYFHTKTDSTLLYDSIKNKNQNKLHIDFDTIQK